MKDTSKVRASISTMIRFWEVSSEPWGAKDNTSTFIYANSAYCRLLGLPVGYDVAGRLDGELPASTAQFQDQFQAHDRKVEIALDRVTSIEIHPFEKHAWLQPWYFDKYPLFDDTGLCCGTIFHGRPVDALVLNSLETIQIPTSLVFSPPSDLFTPSEWDLIFYSIHGFTLREISKKLNLSQRTIENRMQAIYQKTGINNKRAFREFCFQNNFNCYIPQNFFQSSESKFR